MLLQRHSGIPLLVCHFEQVDLRNGPGNVEQRVDAPERSECLLHDFLR
jgi:hypothetical protein